ncbi:MAG: nucleotidyltransferase family protein [Verrucomicrobiae bacterium]|nr:nucleotidyltransferase family protein [Verrucomicrobiae bacterium]
MKLLILAAGYATRLYPLTENQAKPLLPVAGKPMIDHVIEKFNGCPEIDGIYVVTNNKFTPHFEKWAAAAAGKFEGRPITVFNDGTMTNDDRLGAIGDISFVMQKTGLNDDLIVVAGDNLFSGGLKGYVEAAKTKGLLVGVYDVKNLEEVKKYNSLGLDPDGRINFFEEKSPNPRSTVTAIALYHYPKSSLDLIRQYIAGGNNADQPGRLVQWIYPQQPVYTYEIKGLWLDIGSRETYEEAQSLFV